MVAAMKAVEDGGTVGGAAHEHGVPYSTLKDRVSGCVEHGSKTLPEHKRTRRDAMHIITEAVEKRTLSRRSKLHMDGGIAFKKTSHLEGVTVQLMYTLTQSLLLFI